MSKNNVGAENFAEYATKFCANIFTAALSFFVGSKGSPEVELKCALRSRRWLFARPRICTSKQHKIYQIAPVHLPVASSFSQLLSAFPSSSQFLPAPFPVNHYLPTFEPKDSQQFSLVTYTLTTNYSIQVDFPQLFMQIYVERGTRCERQETAAWVSILAILRVPKYLLPRQLIVRFIAGLRIASYKYNWNELPFWKQRKWETKREYSLSSRRCWERVQKGGIMFKDTQSNKGYICYCVRFYVHVPIICN